MIFVGLVQTNEFHADRATRLHCAFELKFEIEMMEKIGFLFLWNRKAQDSQS
jgi:hypothetical protein